MDLFRKGIEERANKDLSSSRIFREIKQLGYTGGKTILGTAVREIKAQKPFQKNRQVKRRFETSAGHEMQIDWSPGTVLIGGEPTKIHVLGVLLCYSRKVFYAIYRGERQKILLEGLSEAFQYFQGVAIRCVFDNMSTVVLGRIGRERLPNWTPGFIEFAEYYGFTPFLCRVAEPNRKGYVK